MMDLETKKQKAEQSIRLYRKQNGCCAICGNHYDLPGLQLHHESDRHYYDYTEATDDLRCMLCPTCHKQVSADRAVNNLMVTETYKMYLHSLKYHPYGDTTRNGKVNNTAWVSIGFAREPYLTYPEVTARCSVTDVTGKKINTFWGEFMEQCGYYKNISAQHSVEQISECIANNEDFMFDVTVTKQEESGGKIYFNTNLNYVFRNTED